MTKLAGAFKKLRDHLGDSQQAFATRVKLSMRAIANYEKDRVPTVEILTQMMNLADKHGRADLADVFHSALTGQIGYEVPRHTGLTINGLIDIGAVFEAQRRFDAGESDEQIARAVNLTVEGVATLRAMHAALKHGKGTKQ